MKKATIFVFGLLLAGAAFVGTSLDAHEDIDQWEKANHQRTLRAIGIEVSAKELETLNIITDQNGKKWMYSEFTERVPLIEKLEEKYPEDVKSSFLEMEDKIMQKYSKVGDFVPIVLMDEDLKEGSFTFSRDNGEVLSFALTYQENTGRWSYKKVK